MNKFLKVHKTKILDQRNKLVILKGVNLGGWLMMEGYILHAPNVAAQVFKKKFLKTRGRKELEDFESNFRNNFIREADFKKISKLGFNCLRVPFNARLIETAPYRYSKEGLKYLDRVLRWAKKYGLWVILDLHAACGAQNHDWHSDSLGTADLWRSRALQKRTLALWTFLADRYKDNTTLAGYDILNEAVIHDTKKLNTFYKEVIKAIRSADKNHILFIEGNKWAQDLDCLDVFDDDNIVLSVHFYEPLEFTFNFVPHLSYPLRSNKGVWDKKKTRKILQHYHKIAQKRSCPVFVGEFGINSRQNKDGEGAWLKDVLSCFKEFGFHWTYWTYKAVKHYTFPDGIFSYYPNDPWVSRHGPHSGWNTYHLHWPTKKREMVRSWKTESFHPNDVVLKTLKNVLR